ncbi:hypothetical protein [Frigoriflavimonas asaccharolytica]|uniref:Uncharacterized protein n=1 Tax=Frigoriflavimonas asaccharolytica TaxID=2735899 RepID=A0A8J8G919_9FLAO|nr:hypothetical protein [Frigoriflavimonas asaccharolytica]NRS93353.1 hypothetical protein [Frigoriflavimonas asaccharolytica]
MKIVINFLFSLIVFGASFQNSLFMIDYKINQDFYEIHCINKAKPELDCHGKCQAKKETEKTSNPFSQVKYSFEFKILPSAPFKFLVENQPLLKAETSKFKYQELFVPTIFLKIPAIPPQI